MEYGHRVRARREALNLSQRDLAERSGIKLKVATIVERLPAEFKAEYPDVEWSNINLLQNLVAHQYDKVNDDLMFVTLRRDIPTLVKRLGLPE